MNKNTAQNCKHRPNLFRLSSMCGQAHNICTVRAIYSAFVSVPAGSSACPYPYPKYSASGVAHQFTES